MTEIAFPSMRFSFAICWVHSEAQRIEQELKGMYHFTIPNL